ncbi:hypothetical protein Vafri_10618 [Volvox africanus]|nr:hypothetical protein Vafri_10618 [Volvox africanus]
MDGGWMACRGTYNEKRSSSAAAADINACSGADAAKGYLEEDGHLPSVVLRSPAVGEAPRHRSAITAVASVTNIVPAASLPPHDRCGSGRVSGSGTMRRRVSKRRRLLAVWSAFAVSGVMHEACLMYMCHNRLEGSFRMMAFFLLQPLIMIAQDNTVEAVSGLVPERLRRSRAAVILQIVVTLALVLLSADQLFWGPFETCRVDERGLAEAMGAFRAVGDWCGRLAVRLPF